MFFLPEGSYRKDAIFQNRAILEIARSSGRINDREYQMAKSMLSNRCTSDENRWVNSKFNMRAYA